jgi:hypothetical protein
VGERVLNFMLADDEGGELAPAHTQFLEPPPWVLLATTRNTGTRLKKREREYETHHLGHPMYGAAQGGYDDTSGVDHSKALRKRAKWEQKVAARKACGRGNLGESDYQFWRGSSSPTVRYATCRWCERFFYNVEDRQKHFRVEGNCSRLIRTVQEYAGAAKERFCLVCASETTKLRWGFPLCNSITCIGSWKYGPLESYHGWAMYKAQAKDAGLLRQWEIPK